MRVNIVTAKEEYIFFLDDEEFAAFKRRFMNQEDGLYCFNGPATSVAIRFSAILVVEWSSTYEEEDE